VTRGLPVHARHYLPVATFIVCACNPSHSKPVDPPAEAAAAPSVSASTPTRASAQPAPATSTAADSALTIDALVARLSSPQYAGSWINGGYPKLALPSSASTEEVLRLMFQRMSFDEGRVTTFEIKEERDVTIGHDTRPYHAVRLDTDRGNVIVLLRYQEPSASWWSRAYRR
jgi:hypothetical protein